MEGNTKAGEMEVIDQFRCLKCRQLPRETIYQCKNGHIICPECHCILETCPSPGCKTLLNQLHPIRNIWGERVLEEFAKVNCSFNGCGKRICRATAENHAAACTYNLQKYGPLVNLCQKLGYPLCNFELNNGNTTLAIEHFKKEHGFHVTQLQKFQMKLEQFRAAIFRQNSYCVWTPIIAKLPGSNQGHLLLASMLNQTEDFACISILLPDSSHYSPLERQVPNQIEFELIENENLELCNAKMSFVQNSISIGEAMKHIAHRIPGPILLRNLENVKLLCKINGSSLIRTVAVNEAIDIETFTCIINPPLKTNFLAGATEKTLKCLEDIEKKCNRDRDQLWPFLCKLFEDKTNPDGFNPDETAYLKTLALDLVLRQGTAAQLIYLRSKGSNLNCSFDGGKETALHYVLKQDSDKRVGLEKVKILVDSGADFKRVNDQAESVLHYASRYGNEATVAYVLDNLKLEINGQTNNRSTPLFYSACNEDDDCAVNISKLLVEKGADYKAKNSSCCTFLSWAKLTLRSRLEEALQLPQRAPRLRNIAIMNLTGRPRRT